MSLRIVAGLLAGAATVLVAAPAQAAPAAGCALPAFPTAACTGVPAGTTYAKTVTGDYTATTAGQVIDKWHITGALLIRASGVVVRNSRIDDLVDNEDAPGTSFSITDSTVGPVVCSTGGLPSIQAHDVTATRVLLQGHQDALDVVGNNVTVTDSLLHPCYQPPEVVGGDGFHSDGVQDLCAAVCSNLRLTHNTVDARAFDVHGVSMGNSALNLGSAADGKLLRTVTLDSNLFLGGAYTTSLTYDGGTKWPVKNNVWASGAYQWGPISAEGTCSGQTWTGNSIANVDANYHVVSTVQTTGCVD